VGPGGLSGVKGLPGFRVDRLDWRRVFFLVFSRAEPESHAVVGNTARLAEPRLNRWPRGGDFQLFFFFQEHHTPTTLVGATAGYGALHGRAGSIPGPPSFAASFAVEKTGRRLPESTAAYLVEWRCGHELPSSCRGTGRSESCCARADNPYCGS